MKHLLGGSQPRVEDPAQPLLVLPGKRRREEAEVCRVLWPPQMVQTSDYSLVLNGWLMIIFVV